MNELLQDHVQFSLRNISSCGSKHGYSRSKNSLTLLSQCTIQSRMPMLTSYKLVVVLAAASTWASCAGFHWERHRQRTALRVVDLLINRHYPRFQQELGALLAGPDGSLLSDKNSYELCMQEVLTALSPQFVVIQSALTDHVLIPQCRCPKRRAFLLQYRVLRTKNFSRASVDDHLEYEAHVALGEVDIREEALAFVSQFRHVREVVKVGLAFYNRSRTALLHKIEYVNGPKRIDSVYDYEV